MNIMGDPDNIVSQTNEGSSARKSIWRSTLKVLLCVGLVALIYFYISIREVMDIVANSNPWYLCAVGVLFYVDRAVMAYKWDRLLVALGAVLPYSLLFHTYTISPITHVVLPSGVSGDLFRLYCVSRAKVDSKAVVASIVMERTLALVSAMVLASVALVLTSHIWKNDEPSLAAVRWMVVLGIVMVMGMVGMMHGVSRGVIDKLAARLSTNRVVEKVHATYVLLCEYRKHFRTIAIVYAWTLAEQFVPIVWHFLLVRAFHINLSFVEICATVPLIVLAVRFPFSLDAIGVQEGLYIAIFGLMGVSAAQAFVLSSAGRVLTLICALPWGIHFIMKDPHGGLAKSGSGL